MKQLLFTILIIPTLVACSTTETNKTSTTGGVYLTPKGQSRIRLAETVKQYSFNPYVDPNNPDVRYSEGELQKIEQSPQWDLTPGAHLSSSTANTGVAVAGRKKVEEGPMEEVSNDQVISPKAVPAHLEQELVRERQYRQALAEQLQGQIEITKEFTKQLIEAKQLAEQNRQLHDELKATREAAAAKEAEEKAKEEVVAARKAQPFYKRWFSTKQ